MRGRIRQIIVVLSVLIMLATNFGFGQNDFSDATVERSIYYTLMTAFTPASYTFAVWLPIFLGCIIFALYQGLPVHRNDSRFDALAMPMVLAFLSNALTPFTPIGISNIAIIALLISLIWAFITLLHLGSQDRVFFWLVRVPIVLFFAWITVATILNISQGLVSIRWSGFGIADTLWSALLIGLATLIGLSMVARYGDIAYGLVLIWAFWGIVAARPEASSILWTTRLSTLILLGAMIRVWRKANAR